jgi:hypothetical protein
MYSPMALLRHVEEVLWVIVVSNATHSQYLKFNWASGGSRKGPWPFEQQALLGATLLLWEALSRPDVDASFPQFQAAQHPHHCP